MSSKFNTKSDIYCNKIAAKMNLSFAKKVNAMKRGVIMGTSQMLLP